MLHDWADEYCVTILKHLRAAAGSKTQLVVVEQLIACVCDEPVTHEIPGAEVPVSPSPLLHNSGRAASMAYNTDVMVRKYTGMITELTYFSRISHVKDDGPFQRSRTHCDILP